MIKRMICALAALMLVCAGTAIAEDEEWSILDGLELLTEVEVILDADDAAEPPPAVEAAVEAQTEPGQMTAREDLIERIIALGKKLFDKAGGRPQRAHYAGDIYVCKNFTVHLFRQNRDDFRIAAYPNRQLVIPNNLPAAKCKPYYYGMEWEPVSAENGNPFYAAAEFRYDSALSYEENLEKAMEFMRQVRRGDYFQMSANYRYGVGAHSAIMISDYDPETDTVHWMDSNMRGTKKNGERYGYVQFDEVRPIQWWAEAFCHKKRGATIYRLRDDIVYAEGAGPR